MAKESLLQAFTRAVAAGVERRIAVPDAARPALRATVDCEIRAWLPILSGERLYVGEMRRVIVRRRLSQAEAQERQARILAALQAGEPAATVARREKVTTRWVYRIRSSSGA